jgi:CheY-like chemotaxis protein
VGWHPLYSSSPNGEQPEENIDRYGNDSFRHSLREFIRTLGHEVFEATSGLEAIDKAASLRPDLIMMDVRLPDVTGDEVRL